MTSRRMPRTARFLLWTGVALFWMVQLTLALVVGMPFLDSVVIALLLAVVPLFSLAQLPMVEGVEIERIPAYWASIVTLWLLGTACWLVGTRAGGPGAVGMVWIRPGALVTWATVLTGAALGIIVVFRGLATRLGVRDTPILRQLLPRTGRERGVFALLSVAAGTAEEVAYRGYAIPVLIPLVGVGGAVALSSVAFGVVHGYQGALGMARTAVMGAVLGWGFLASGSLWPAVLAHVLIDLLAGIVLADRLLSPEAAGGVGDAPELLES